MRKFHLAKLVLIATLLAGCGSGNQAPAAAMNALENAQDYELYSLDPEHLSSPAPDNFHNYKVLGKTSITAVAARHELNDALQTAIREGAPGAPACFNPRHGIRVTDAGKTMDLVICFECTTVEVYEDGKKTGSFLISNSPKPVFDAALQKAGVELAPMNK